MNTGKKIYRYLRQIDTTSGLPTGIFKPNDPSDPDYVHPQIDYDACPIVTWKPINPACVTRIACNIGWELVPGISPICRKIESQLAVRDTNVDHTNNVINSINSNQWGRNGTYLMTAGYDVTGQGSIRNHLVTPRVWLNGITPNDTLNSDINGPLNRSAVNLISSTDWLSIYTQINIPTSGTYYIGISATEYFSIDIDAVNIITSPSIWTNPIITPSNTWILYPVELTAGVHSFLFKGKRSVSTGAFGAELYGASYSSLVTATQLSNLSIIFSTRQRIGSFFDDFNPLLWTCPAGWTLDNSNPLAPVCKLTTTTSVNILNTGQATYTQRQKYINANPALNESDEPIIELNLPDSGDGPYFLPYEDLINCPIL